MLQCIKKKEYHELNTIEKVVDNRTETHRKQYVSLNLGGKKQYTSELSFQGKNKQNQNLVKWIQQAYSDFNSSISVLFFGYNNFLIILDSFVTYRED